MKYKHTFTFAWLAIVFIYSSLATSYYRAETRFEDGNFVKHSLFHVSGRKWLLNGVARHVNQWFARKLAVLQGQFVFAGKRGAKHAAIVSGKRQRVLVGQPKVFCVMFGKRTHTLCFDIACQTPRRTRTKIKTLSSNYSFVPSGAFFIYYIYRKTI